MGKRKMTKTAQAEAARAIRLRFSNLGQRLDPQSGLGKMLKIAERSEHRKPSDIVTSRDVFDGQAVAHMCDALSVLDDCPKASEYLRKLISGSLSSYDRGRSVAKDTFWEIDTCYQMRRAGLSANLAEHPDVAWSHDKARIGIECKKIHSNARLQNALSQAVGQLLKTTDYGFVAVNIDEFVPGTLKVDKWENTDIMPQKILSDFCKEHERHLVKYLNENRVSGFLIFCSVRVILRQPNGRPGLYFTKQWQFFTRPDLPQKHATHAKILERAMRHLTEGSK